jgi:hypothetical protein
MTSDPFCIVPWWDLEVGCLFGYRVKVMVRGGLLAAGDICWLSCRWVKLLHYEAFLIYCALILTDIIVSTGCFVSADIC